jgi:hypothetical protein
MLMQKLLHFLLDVGYFMLQFIERFLMNFKLLLAFIVYIYAVPVSFLLFSFLQCSVKFMEEDNIF